MLRKGIFLKSVCLFSVCLLLGFPSVSWAAKKKHRSGPYRVSARSAILSNSTKVKRLYGKNVHQRVFPASTTKVMTAILVLERLPLDSVVTISSRAAMVQPSKIGIRPGEKYRVADLLYAVLLKSANDASVALAEAVAGSEEKFVQMMNARARGLGARNTKFANAHGLPSASGTQYSTAYDMYLIFREALNSSFFRRAIALKHKAVYSLAGRKILLRSHNKLLFKGWQSPVHGKTGYTRQAQSCFVGYLPRQKDTLIIAVFGCSRRWEDIRHILTKYGRINL